jgi:hypothetical protein
MESSCRKLRFAIRNDAREFSVGANLSVDFCFTAHALNARARAQRSHFKHQRVTGNNGAAKPSFFDSGEQDQLLIAVINLTQRENSAALSHRLNHQNAWHYRCTGEMTLKIFFVEADLFDADDSFAWHEFDDAIDEEERIAMRQKFLNAFSVENGFHEDRVSTGAAAQS